MQKLLFFSLFFLLFYARFVGLDWGLPYPMHPDERNMAVALQQLNCKEFLTFNFQFSSLRQCFNPHFYAYGQFPLYFGYIIITVWHVVTQRVQSPISFVEATLALRIISAVSSLINAYVLFKIFALFRPKFALSLRMHWSVPAIMIIFQPYFIQFSHFGTTESILMLLYSVIIYQLLIAIGNKKITGRTLFIVGLTMGMSTGIKVSSSLFALSVVFAYWYIMLYGANGRLFAKLFRFLGVVFMTGLCALVFFILTSPHNILSFSDFLGTVQYESAVATGAVRVFYTHQFESTRAILFQLEKVLPYVLGLPMFVLALCGFMFFTWRDVRMNFLRFAIVVFFVPTAFLYAKWTRFASPVFPLLTLFGLLCMDGLYRSSNMKNMRRYIKKISAMQIQRLRMTMTIALTIVTLIQGVAYLSIYQNPDVRFRASEWIFENVPSYSYILSETANVIDIPLAVPGAGKKEWYPEALVNFNYYDLDHNTDLQQELDMHLSRADYIIVPSRRIFANYACTDIIHHSPFAASKNKCALLSRQYYSLQEYYSALFSGTMPFRQVAEITSYPRITLFGKTILTLPDEGAEETWTVFDHPVIRIYKRI